MNKIILTLSLLFLTSSITIAQKGHSINSNSIIKQIPKISPKNNGESAEINKSKNNTPLSKPKNTNIKTGPKSKGNSKSEGSKPKKGK